MLRWSDDRLRDMVRQVEATRYNPSDWRNWENRWREFFGLDTTHGRQILDFGCGFGLEALQFAKAGNEVVLADINEDNLLLAARVLRLHGFEPYDVRIVCGQPPFMPYPRAEVCDVFYASGVLHHTPMIREILREAVTEWIEPKEGEVRILVYSDRRWTRHIGHPLPPIDMDISTHSAFQRFVRACDEVGEYADWYTAEKLQQKIEGFGRVKSWRYIGKGEEFIGAVVVPI